MWWIFHSRAMLVPELTQQISHSCCCFHDRMSYCPWRRWTSWCSTSRTRINKNIIYYNIIYCKDEHIRSLRSTINEGLGWVLVRLDNDRREEGRKGVWEGGFTLLHLPLLVEWIPNNACWPAICNIPPMGLKKAANPSTETLPWNVWFWVYLRGHVGEQGQHRLPGATSRSCSL